jgi:sensor domain CHASE-containing protein
VVPLESRNNSVTGLVYAAFNWDDLLQSSVPVSAPAVDIVLLANGQEFTYR